MAYGLAEQYRAAKTKADQKAAASEKKTGGKKAGKVHFNGDRNSLTERQSASLKAIGKIADVLGIQVYVFESKLGKNGRRIGANGWYDSKDGSIHIDLHAGANGEGTMIFTMAHELTHFVRQWSPAKFKILADFLMQEYGKKGVSVDALVREQQAKAKRTGRTISYDTAYEEVVADSMEAMLSDGKVMEKLAKLKAQDAALWQKIKDYINKLAEKIRMAYKGIAPDSIEGRYVAEMKDAVERFQELFTEGLVDASENFQVSEVQKNTTDDGGVEGDYEIKLSPRMEDAFKPYAKAINSVVNQSISGKGNIDGKAQVKDIMPTGPKIVAMVAASSGNRIDISRRSIALSTSDIWHEFKRHTSVGKETSRGQIAFTKRQFQNAVKCIISPDMVETIFADANNPTQRQSFAYAKKTSRGNYVVVEAVGGKKNPNIYPVMILQFSKSKWNKMMSQGKTLGEILFENDPPKLSALDIQQNKKSRVTAAQFASYEAIANTLHSPQLDTKVSQSDASVKGKLSGRDSDGNQLSQEQQEFFKGSKVRDADGNLMVMYHGTPNGGFTKFRSGTYFTPNPGYADVYQNAGASYISTKRNADAPMTYKVYLDIKKPFDTRQAHEQKIFMEEFYRKYGTGTPLADSGLPDWVDGMDLQEFIEEMGYDYDGLILDEGGVGGYGEEVVSRGLSYVVFNPAQVKGVDNKTPTSDPDYRYSDRDYTYEALTSKPDMVVTTVGKNVPTNRADVAAEAKRNAAKVGRFDPKTGSVSVHVDDINTDVILSTKGLRHGLRRSQDPLNVPNYVVTVKAGEILKNSIRVNEITPSDDNAGSSYVLMGAAKDANGTYVVRFVVNHYDNSVASMDVLYALNAKKELAATKSPRLTAEPLSVTSSTISIAELLDLVNEYFPDILPEDVLKHYGYDARPEGDLGDDALYSDRDIESVSNRSLLANAFEGAAQTDMEKQKIREYRGKIDLMNGQEQKLRKLNQQIKELSFAKGKRDTAKIRALRDEATKTANRISIYDKQLLRLESSKPLQYGFKRAKRCWQETKTPPGARKTRLGGVVI